MTAAPIADQLVPTAADADGASLARLMVAGTTDAAPARGLARFTGGVSVVPLAVLFGLSFLDWVGRAMGVALLPEFRVIFELSDGTATVFGLIAVQLGFALTIPVAARADRGNRVRVLVGGSALFALFSLGTALVPTVWWLFFAMRAGAAVGLATVLATHLSLLADTYDIAHRAKVYALHSAAIGLGSAAGLTAASLVGHGLSWRIPYAAIGLLTVPLLLAARRLPEPARGAFERRAMGVTGEALTLEEDPPTFDESQRMLQRNESLRRLFFAMPFLAIAFVGLATLSLPFYDRILHLDVAGQFAIETLAALGQLIGVALAAVLGTRLLLRDPANILRFLLAVTAGAALFLVALALAPTVPLAIVARVGVAAAMAAVLPSVFTGLSLSLPARARSAGFSVAALYALPGIGLLTLAVWVGDTFAMRWAVLVMAPVVLLGGFIASTGRRALDRDIRNTWTTAAARTELLVARQRGAIKQLLVRKLDVKYGDVQILFGVDFEVDQGEIVALLGTNGAGKSTLLRAITGVVAATNGAVVFDGRDITSAPPHEIAGLGIAMVPGGQGVFPSLTVLENLKVAWWGSRQRGPGGPAEDAVVEQALVLFPILGERLGDPAANLSGGQQQMLALAMAFLSRPRLLVIDELSLGLAPVIVEQLLDVVRSIRDQGTTVILVEQSVNVALTLAETAYFMEKGEIRFHGPTAELLERPDVLRSVFLEGAAGHLGGSTAAGSPNGAGSSNGAGSPNGAGALGAAPPAAGPARPAAPRASVVDPGRPPALELVDLSVRFGGIRAVDDVALAVAPGEILGIIGPNGAGKTTLFDLVSGFTRPDGGHILLEGRDITGAGPAERAQRGLGRSFQDARLFPAMTVEDTIKVAMERFIDARDPFNAMLRLPVQQDTEVALQRRVDELVDLLGIGAFRTKFVRELSTGSRRVVDLACVLAHRPSVVLLDEPSSGIAQRESEALAPLIVRIRDALGASILLIEHDMPLVTGVADRLVALDQGRVVVDGAAAEVLNHPDVVASYLGNRQDVIARSGQRAL